MAANYINKKESAIRKMEMLIKKWGLQHVVVDGHIYENKTPGRMSDWRSAILGAQNEVTFI